jgi:hypothetical protein
MLLARLAFACHARVSARENEEHRNTPRRNAAPPLRVSAPLPKEFPMRHKIPVVIGVALASLAVAPAFADEPLTPHAWSTAPALPQDSQPKQEDARAALMSGNASPTPAGPIGASPQTVPAKYSQRNDLLDHMPVMAWPLRLDAQQRQQIYQAVMSDAAKPANDADKLKPATYVPYKQTLEMHPLPTQLAQIDGLQGLEYIKTENKVLLVRPTNRTVVDEITK